MHREILFTLEMGIEAKIVDHDLLALVCFKPDPDGYMVSLMLGLKLAKIDDEELIRIATEKVKVYMENYDPEHQEVTMLHYWYIEEREYNGELYLSATGRVCGHYRIEDSHITHTSPILSMTPDWAKGVMVIQTNNTCYVCPLDYLEWDTQEEIGEDLIPEYGAIKEAYYNKRYMPSIEPGVVLLVISNYDEYYYHGAYYRETQDSEPVHFNYYAHVGMFQDSFLIFSDDYKIDIRYFPHDHNIEFYQEPDIPLYVENIGYCALYVKASCGIIKLNPGERKQIIAENAEPEKVNLSGGDLYPAGWGGFIDDTNG